MATTLRTGWRAWRLQRNDEGHRTYKVRFVVLSDSHLDGPETILGTTGLPAIGDAWTFGNDSDAAALCTPEVTIKHADDDEFVSVWLCDFTFSTRPRERCQDIPIEDPLSEPDRIRGSFVNYTREMTHDRFGNRFRTSSFEQLRGPLVEFDASRATVEIGQNLASLDLELVTALMHHVNDTTLWGLGARKVKLSGMIFTRKTYGVCNFYYDRQLLFDIFFEGYDRLALDEGTKALNGRWAEPGTSESGWVLEDVDGGPPNPDNPTHFSQYLDHNGNPSTVLLDGAGKPATIDPTGTGGSSPGVIPISYYPNGNLTLLGIPLSI